uniref:Calcitonin peptide-like domain-containing protein n=1 Tax=Oryzias latipes TaxID=8090 RepID=A0A3P9IU10_ORYLA
MHHLRLHRLLLLVLLFLRCVVAAPNHRYFSPASSYEQENVPPESEDWSLPEFIDYPFLRMLGPRPQRDLAAMTSHHLEKRKCNTATCVTQRLADFLVRSSNTIGTVYVPTNVGSATYGKRDLRQRGYLPL